MAMEFTQHHTPDGLVIVLRGSFTFKDHHTFRAVLDALKAAGGKHKILDLSQIDFLDSAALGMLLIAEDETTCTSGMLTLRDPSPQVTRLFKLSAMDTLFRIEQTSEVQGHPDEKAPQRMDR